MGFQYACYYDEECPSGYYCYQSNCQDLTYFAYCNSYCSPGCCVDSKCRVSNQKICTTVNSCASGNDCAGQCCIQNKCAQPKLCGVNPTDSDCTDNNFCSSKCCYNNICLDSTNDKCVGSSYLDSQMNNDNIKVWILLAIDILLLIGIILFIYIFRNRLKEIVLIMKEIARNEMSLEDIKDESAYEKGKNNVPTDFHLKSKETVFPITRNYVSQINTQGPKNLNNQNIPNKSNIPLVRQVLQPSNSSFSPPNLNSQIPAATQIIPPSDNILSNSLKMPLTNSGSPSPQQMGNYVIINNSNNKKDPFV